MSRDRIFVMSFGLGGNSGDGITKDGNTYSSSWYLNGPDEFLQYIPSTMTQVRSMAAWSSTNGKCSRSPRARDSGAYVQSPLWARARSTASGHQGRRQQPGSSGVRAR